MKDQTDLSETSIRVDSTEESLARFDEEFSTDPSKRARIDKIHFEVVLPLVGNLKRLKKLQSSAESAANDAAFTRATTALFGRLAAWESRSPGRGVKLTVATRSLNEAKIRELVESGELDQLHNYFSPPIWELRHCFRYIGLSTGDEGDISSPLPRVACVSELEFGCQDSLIHPSALAVLSSALPSVEKVEWKLLMPGRRLMTDRRGIRSALAQGLQHAELPPTLEELTIHVWDDDPNNEELEPGSFGAANDGDDLSLAVRRICQLPSLRKLHLDGIWVLSPVAFGAHPSLPDIHCPSLEHLIIDCSRTAPDGEWMMTGDPELGVTDEKYCGSWTEEDEPAAFDSDDSDTSDYAPEFDWDMEDGEIPGLWFRRRPTATYEALLQSFVEAAGGMPCLRSFEVRIGKNSRAPLDLTRRFPPPKGERGDEGRGDEEKPYWEIFVSRDFDMSWEVPLQLVRALRGPNGDGRVETDLKLAEMR